MVGSIMVDSAENHHNPLSSAAYIHGGNLDAARAAFPDAPQPWIDLSTGISPWSYPVPPLPADIWTRLPQQKDVDILAEIAAAYFGAPASSTVLPVPGTQAAIQALPRLRPPCRVAVIGPTYAEHAQCWSAAGHHVVEVPTLAAALSSDPDKPPIDVVVIVNPNNPDGRRETPAALCDAAARLAERHGWLVVDEAFADPEPALTVAPFIGIPGLIVLRSFGKFFGLAGVRLGFILAEGGLCDRVQRQLGPWAVSGPALAIGTAAYRDSYWIDAHRQRLKGQWERLQQIFHVHHVTVTGACPLFVLVDMPDVGTLFVQLARYGIWSRPFSLRQNWLRIGLPADNEALTRLEIVLLNWNNTPPKI